MIELRPLNHTGTVELETARLVLRQTSITDAAQMFKNWASDPEVTKYLTWQPHADIEVTRSILANWDKENAKTDYYHWGMVLKENQEIIGTTGTLGIDGKNHSTELGYCMSRSLWGNGYMTEAVAAIIEHLFSIVGLNRITSRHNPENIGSGRVMQKCGMVFEGIQRQAHYCERRGFYDLASYAILRVDFDKQHLK